MLDITATLEKHGAFLQVPEEAADLLYHLNVLLIGREMGWKDVIRELESRHAATQPGS